MAGEDLGDRMKGYESVSRGALVRRCPVIIRVDGRAFHAWTRGMSKPYDFRLVEWMRMATQDTANAMQGCLLAYVQSDEASFLLADWQKEETQPWFGYVLSKVVSLAASTFTAHFNREATLENFKVNTPAIFDARAFNIPREDVANYFLWRAKDCRRNSVQGLAQEHFSPKQLHGISNDEALAMLSKKGIEWSSLRADLRCGSFLLPELRSWAWHIEPRYTEIAELVKTAEGRIGETA